MSRDEIIQEIQSEEYISICKKLSPNLWKDLYQEFSLAVLELKESKVQEIECAKCFLVKILMNMCRSNNSRFYKTYKKYLTKDDYKEIFLLHLSDPQLPSRKEIDRAISELYWFDRDILKLYIQYGSARQVEKRTRINIHPIIESLNKSRQQLKCLIKR